MVKFEEIKIINDLNFDEIHGVRNKEVFRLKVSNPMRVSHVKEVLRNVLIKSGVGIRKRIDIGEDNWLGKEYVYGETLAVIRTGSKISNKNKEDIKNLLDESVHGVELISCESFEINDFRNIVEKYDRCLSKVLLDVKEILHYSISESNGRWKQPVLQWNGEIEDEKVEGIIRISAEKIAETDSNIYEVLIDAPYGLDVYRMLEQEFGLKRGSLEGYPIESIVVYESVDGRVNHLGRKKCPFYNVSIERTVGGLVGDKCVKAFMADKDTEVVKGKLK